MRCLIWNMRGFGARGRCALLKDYLRKVKIDIIFLQETIRQSFTCAELDSLDPSDKFDWEWIPVNGQSGGMLLGVRTSTLQVGAIDLKEFLINAFIYHFASKVRFQFVGVYGPADHSRSGAFLNELEQQISSMRFPVIVGGDFNLICGIADKNN